MAGPTRLPAAGPSSRRLSLLTAAGLLTGLLAVPAFGNALDDVQLLRQSGCGGLMPATRPLHHSFQLDRAAAQWALGRPMDVAADRAGYTADRLAGVHVTGVDAAILQALRHKQCVTLMNHDLTDVGFYRRGRETWLVLGSAYLIPPPTRSSAFPSQVLELVNAVRTRGTYCGTRAFAPTGPVHPSTALAQIAQAHAADMAQHDYFQHQDRRGRTPADRVRAAGYRERLVGENIAFGPTSAAEVVRGWLQSPGHCENIMNPRFTQMGVSYALGPAPRGSFGRGLYWDQLLVDPL